MNAPELDISGSLTWEEGLLRPRWDQVQTLQCPLTLYVGEDAREVNEPLAAQARQLGKECVLVSVPGDHQAMVAPAVRKAIGWFQLEPGK
jgi:hypothetical protein